MKIINIFKSPLSYLVLIIILGFYVRLYRIDNPVADWHSWRQADTASVARNFYQEGFNPFVPKYDDMSAVSAAAGFNPQRYRFVEFPIYESIVYFGYLINGGVKEQIARLISIIFSLGSCVLIFFIAKKYFGSVTALFASFLYGFLPYNIYFSRTILPEPSLVFFSLGMFYFTDKWIFDNSKSNFFLGALFGMAAFLTKPMAVFYLVPLIYSYFVKEKNMFKLQKKYIFYLLVVLLPVILWRFWISRHPEGIPASAWLLNGNGIRFKPAFWRWIIQDRFGREILSVTGTVLLSLGVLLKPREKEGYLLHLLFLSMMGYLIIFATGNVQHDYYQYFIIPALVIFVARGVVLLSKGLPFFLPRFISISVAFFLVTIMLGLTWFEVRGLYQINNPLIIEAGKEADKILPKSAIVIAPYMGDTAFLYHTNRSGFPFTPLAVDEMIRRFNTTSYVSVTYDGKTKWLMKKYMVIEATPDYVIIDLTKVNPNFYDDIKSPEDLKEPL